jgi:cytochrome P450
VHADDVIPLSKPIRDANGELIDRISVKKGTFVYVPIMSIQRSKDLWGNDAGEFKPGRWLDNSISQQRASEIQGYRHLLTFLDGPRTCLGKHFALTAFKVRP